MDFPTMIGAQFSNESQQCEYDCIYLNIFYSGVGFGIT